jgi:hypothetical protein
VAQRRPQLRHVIVDRPAMHEGDTIPDYVHERGPRLGIHRNRSSQEQRDRSLHHPAQRIVRTTPAATVHLDAYVHRPE